MHNGVYDCTVAITGDVIMVKKAQQPEQMCMNIEFDKELHQGNVKDAMKGVRSRDLWQVEVDKICVLPNFNVRQKNKEYYDHIRYLADSMKRVGFYQHEPLAGYIALENGKQVIYVHDGHCRLEAVKIAIQEGAEIERLPMVVSPSGTSRVDLTVSLIRSNSGKPLSVYETAIVCKRLTGFGWDAAEIAEKVGFQTVQYVEDMLMLVGAPLEIQRLVADNQTSASHAIETIKKYGEKALAVLQDGLAKATAQGKTRVTGRHMPGAVFRKQVRKAAEPMFHAIKRVREDKGYQGLAPEVREVLDKLLLDLKDADGDLAGMTQG